MGAFMGAKFLKQVVPRTQCLTLTCAHGVVQNGAQLPRLLSNSGEAATFAAVVLFNFALPVT